jgi:hypothetical protein
MSTNPELSKRLFKVSAFALLVVLVTTGIFFVLVAPEARSTPFFFWLSILCTAEFVAFAWYANGLVAAGTGQQLTGATRMTIHVLIAGWFAVTLVASTVLAHSPDYQPATLDRIGVLYAVLTLLLFLAVSALYSRDLRAQREDDEAQVDRQSLRHHLVDVEQLAAVLRRAVASEPEQAVSIDRLLKRLDGLKTDFEYASPRSTGDVAEPMERIVEQIKRLCACEADIGGENLGAGITEATSCLERLELLFRERQRETTKSRSE